MRIRDRLGLGIGLRFGLVLVLRRVRFRVSFWVLGFLLLVQTTSSAQQYSYA